MSKSRAAARVFGSMLFLAGAIVFCLLWVPAPLRWVITVYAFVGCPTILALFIAWQNRRREPEQAERYEPPARRRHNNRGLQLRVERDSAERGGRKFA